MRLITKMELEERKARKEGGDDIFRFSAEVFFLILTRRGGSVFFVQVRNGLQDENQRKILKNLHLFSDFVIYRESGKIIGSRNKYDFEFQNY